MNTRLLIPLLCAGAVALACGSLTRHDAPATHVTTARAATSKRVASHAAPLAAPNVNGNFAVNVEPHALHFALKLTNDSKKHVELSFPSGQQYDFAVLDSVGREVYRWGAGRMFTQSVQNKLIEGEDTMHIDERAELTLPHGKYVAVATLRSSNFPISQRSAFELR
jgi:Intracellular proteinase inhibitor